MTFWLVLGLMTAVAIGAVLWPFMRRPSAATGGNDLAVYRDQLEEIDRDRDEGAIGAAEAEAARVEVSRRLLAAADAAAAAGKDAAPGFSARRWLAAALVLALPLGAVSLYLRYGSPDLPAQPLAERIARAHSAAGVGADPEAEQLAGLVTKVEAHLAANPDDGRGWEVLAPVYMRLDRYDEAVKAHRNAIRLLGASADRSANLGESLVAAADGTVTAEARAELERARQMDPDNVTAGFYLGVAAKQAGQRDEAARIWQDMIDRAPAGADWVPFFQRALAALDGKPEQAAPAAAAFQPPEELPPEQREMARGMIERLAARLKEDGSDPEAWLRLVRSYMVVAERDSAREALANARRALANDPDKLNRLNAGVQQLGLEGGVLAALQGAAPAAPAAPAGGVPAALPPSHPPIGSPAAQGPASGAAASGAASAMPPEQQDTVRGMVDRLATRLKQNGSDVDGWLRLLRSYVVLGDRDKAKEAAGDARRALAAEPDKLNRLEDGVKELGIEG